MINKKTLTNCSCRTMFLLASLFILPQMLFAQRNSQTRADTSTVRPVEIHDVFTNPGKGFMTFQRFNGDPEHALQGCCGDFREDYPFPLLRDEEGNLYNENYPNTSIAYFRFYWRALEPEQGEYRWDIIDRALKIARERGQTLLLAVMSYGSPGSWDNDVPDWYREMVGYRTDWHHDNPVNSWTFNPEDPRHIKYFGGFVRKMGERYDGHPDLEAVDVRITGSWGEGGGSAMLTQRTREALIDAYAETFKETPLIMLMTDERTNKYGLSQADMGWRADCMGDIGFFAHEPGNNGWSHMFDKYPRGIIDYGLRDAWKKAPVSIEICYTFNGWDQRNLTDEDVDYIFSEGLKWNMSSFNAKSSPVPQKWQPAVDEWIKNMGYRYVLRKFSYPKIAAPRGEMFFSSWWVNKGSSPIYREYLVAFRFRNDEITSRPALANADIREWLPGDIVYDDKIYVPGDLPEGEYTLDIALVTHPGWREGEDPEPAIKLAIDGRMDDGWYPLGKIKLEIPY